mgnify:FL=1
MNQSTVERIFSFDADGTLISQGIYNILRLDGQTTTINNKAVVLKFDNTTGDLSFDRVI